MPKVSAKKLAAEEQIKEMKEQGISPAQMRVSLRAIGNLTEAQLDDLLPQTVEPEKPKPIKEAPKVDLKATKEKLVEIALGLEHCYKLLSSVDRPDEKNARGNLIAIVRKLQAIANAF